MTFLLCVHHAVPGPVDMDVCRMFAPALFSLHNLAPRAQHLISLQQYYIMLDLLYVMLELYAGPYVTQDIMSCRLSHAGL